MFPTKSHSRNTIPHNLSRESSLPAALPKSRTSTRRSRNSQALPKNASSTNHVCTSINDFNRDGSYNAALAIIDEANLNCCGGDIGDNTNDIFQAEEKRRQEEEKIRLAAEQAAEQAKNNENNSQNTDSEDEEEEIKKPKKKSGFRKFLNKFMDLAQNMVSEEDNLTSNNKKETEKGE